jgi:hypothetical protein
MSLGVLVGYNEESDYAVGDYSDWHNYELSARAEYAISALCLSCFNVFLGDQ